MGRFQRYVQQLSEREWEALWEEAQGELGPASQRLLQELRFSRVAIPLRSSRRELIQRLERWVWRRLWRRTHERTPIYRPAPVEWLWIGAQAYYRAGLWQAALSLLHQVISQKSWPVEELLLAARWHTEQGEIRAAYRAMRSLEHLVFELYRRTQRNRLQLLLVRLFEEYGGSYTQPAQRLIRIIARLRRWEAPLPSTPDDYAAECNLRGTWALIQGDLEGALKWYTPPSSSARAYAWQLKLNAVLVHLYAQAPEGLEQLLAIPPDQLSAFDRLVWFERLLLGLLSQGDVSLLQALLPHLSKVYMRLTPKPLMQLMWIQLQWIGGESFQSVYERLEAFIQGPLLRRRAALLWQAHLVKLLLAVEADEVRLLLRAYEDIQRFLRKHRRDFTSAQTMLRLIRYLYRTRLVQKPFSQAMALWEAHLHAFPAERYFWRHTLLPDWIAARSERLSLRRYIYSRPERGELLEGVQEILTRWPLSE